MEGYHCHVSYHGIALFLLDRIKSNVEWIAQHKGRKKSEMEEIRKRFDEIEKCEKELLNMIPDNDEEESDKQ